ncbi:toll/interleukin-1 receptor domain-containing protein [Algibacter lectus]|uniref:Pentapeptide repeat protein n=1 Tax=Algibacter lectus TaxID=221126 RepID=A0A4R8MB40_9FLAO|nr:pentapeptide repeat-containing protein [Algibacter lectus]MWW25645.1 TIR domain-containing protein [Algibacter lectus]TDY60926.1 pentapeptide repeat protein [Algibacter lectus]
MDIEGYLTFTELTTFFKDSNKTDLKIDEQSISKGHPISLGDTYDERTIVNKKITGSKLKSLQVQGVKFFECKFYDCDLTGTLFWMTTFENCIFENTVLERAVFRKSQLISTEINNCKCRFYLNISESYIYDSVFNHCYFEGLEISGTDTVSTVFYKTVIDSARYQANFSYGYLMKVTPEEYLDEEDKMKLQNIEVNEDLVFEDCNIQYSLFKSVEFIDTFFKGCELSKNTFSDCILFDYNFDETNNKKGWGTNSIDIKTLNESENLSKDLLKKIFNQEERVQQLIKNELSNKIMSSVFISYSLKDAKIANAINQFLKDNNVSTFLWEKNALGGQPLKSIMKSNIDSNDRLLFIASGNSLKSEACHYELTQGRKKQDKLWKTILFPIHIDSFLFDIDFDDIRPKPKKDEFWENIQELRDINSLDFTEFKSGIAKNKKEFEEKMNSLLESLKIN